MMRLIFFFILYITHSRARLANDISLAISFVPVCVSFTPVFVLNKFTASFYRWVFNIFYLIVINQFYY